jgi:hypothetical protein
MIIIGELTNVSRKAIEAQDADAIAKVAADQAAADYIDVNAAIIAAEALAGKDNFCMNDRKAFRAGMFE